MAKRDEVFTSAFLSAPDLKGKPRVVEIEECWQETFKKDGGKETSKTVVKFVGNKKCLVANMVNWDAIAEITGEDDTIAWPGHSIVIYPTKTNFGGKQVDCIRVRAPKESQPAQLPQPAQQAKQVATDVDFNDEIPWK